MTAIATPKAVFNAANEMHACGQPVTIDTVIARIKGGSKSTVGPLLEAWDSMLKTETEAIPESLEARVRELAAVIWHEAERKSAGRLAAARRDFDTELQARDVIVEHTLAPLQALESEVLRLQAALQIEQVRNASLLAGMEMRTEAEHDPERHPLINAKSCAACGDRERITAKLKVENAVLRQQLALFAPRGKRRSKPRSTSHK
jgi:hypothetical protein